MNCLRNCWYVAAWSTEIPPGTMLARTLLEVPVLLFRTPDGQIAAIEDRCAHRFAPLSRGCLTATGVQCGYHGLVFNSEGKCVSNPHGPIAKGMAVRSYPVAEAFRAVWIWMGARESADAALLPDFSFVDATATSAFSSGYLNSNGHYQLYVDNIMDLSHTDFLHPNTLGGGAITRSKGVVTETSACICVEWRARGEVLSPIIKEVMQTSETTGNVWTRVEWFAPGLIKLTNGATPGALDRSAGVETVNLHLLTPETDARTHYFFCSTRDFSIEDADLNNKIASTRAHIFATEDKPMIEAQSERMRGQEFWSLGPMLMSIDQGPVRVRRRLDAMIKEENEGLR